MERMNYGDGGVSYVFAGLALVAVLAVIYMGLLRIGMGLSDIGVGTAMQGERAVRAMNEVNHENQAEHLQRLVQPRKEEECE